MWVDNGEMVDLFVFIYTCHAFCSSILIRQEHREALRYCWKAEKGCEEMKKSKG